jgi:putative oxidoreductase
MEEPLQSWIALLARACIGSYFLVSGVHKGIWYSKAVEEFRAARVPLLHFFLIGTVALHVVASVCLLAGAYVRPSAVALAGFSLVATWRVHDFWNRAGEERLAQSRIAGANLAVIGGLLLLAAFGPGAITVG